MNVTEVGEYMYNVTQLVTKEYTQAISKDNSQVGGKEYIKDNLGTAVPYLIVATSICVIGVFGNILVLLAMATYDPLRRVGNIFLVNLALADLIVASIADPFSIVGKWRHCVASIADPFSIVAPPCGFHC